MTPLKGWIDEVKDFPAEPEPDSPLTAMISAGQPAGDLERAILRLELIKKAQDAKLSWAQIAAILKYPSGVQLKKDTHRLHEHVTKQLRLAQNRDAKVIP